MARACWTVSKAVVASSFHGGISDGHFVHLSREGSGCKIAEPPVINF